jgi:3-oxoacyl-[acyl-carrier protein] reductase
MQRLKDRVAIITGGAKGIGKATAELFLQAGARVAIWDIDTDAGESAVANWQQNGYPVSFKQVDTRHLGEVQAAAAEVVSEWGQIDILINNAGITRDASLKKMTAEQWQQVIDVNLTGVFNCTKAVAPYMVERGYGRIVSAASVVGLYGNFGQTNYVAAKAGLIGMTKVWAREFGRKGITANAVAPGFIETDMVADLPEGHLEQVKARSAIPRLGTPQDIAQAYLFLASEEASFITGVTLSVDGGLVV